MAATSTNTGNLCGTVNGSDGKSKPSPSLTDIHTSCSSATILSIYGMPPQDNSSRWSKRRIFDCWPRSGSAGGKGICFLWGEGGIITKKCRKGLLVEGLQPIHLELRRTPPLPSEILLPP